MQNLNKLTADEFRNEGLLQEVNRLFFHPRGLELEIVQDKYGELHFGMVRDYRNTGTTPTLPNQVVLSDTAEDVAHYIAESFDIHSKLRKQELGYVIQPLGK